MNKPSKIQQIFLNSYADFRSSVSHVSGVQEKAAQAILNCKSGNLGRNISQCADCGHIETLHADLLLAGITQLVTVMVANKIHQHQYLRSLKPLIA